VPSTLPGSWQSDNLWQVSWLVHLR